ncbi:unnamed protein product, partial [Ilex paraguariensis]
MTQLCRRMLRFNIKRRILWRVSTLRRSLFSFWNKVLACLMGKSIQYRQLPHTAAVYSTPPSGAVEGAFPATDTASRCCGLDEESSDLVVLKISLLGDCHTGKTSFLTKYVGRDEEQEGSERTGINQIDKTLSVGGARIAYTIWEVGGDENSHNQIPIACKDSVAMLFMFDLTSRCTLN